MSHQDVLHGNNLDLLAAVRDNFAHAVVTDPPWSSEYTRSAKVGELLAARGLVARRAA